MRARPEDGVGPAAALLAVGRIRLRSGAVARGDLASASGPIAESGCPNPKQMDNEKRIFIAFLLSLAVLMLWRFIVPPPPPAPETNPAKTAAQSTGSPAKPQAPGGSGSTSPTPSADKLQTLPIRVGQKPQDFVIEGQLYRITLSSQGAVVKDWVLKKYPDENGHPLDVINQPACEQLGFPMSISLADASLADKLNHAVYVGDQAGSPLVPPTKLAFDYSDGHVAVHKEFSFTTGYEVDVQVSVRNAEQLLPVQVAWPGGFGDHSLPVKTRESASRAVYGRPGSLKRVPQRKVSQALTIPGPLVLGGLEDRFFVDVFLPGSPEDVFRIESRAWNPPDWREKEPPKPLEVMLGTPEPKPLAFRLLVAPKDLDVLRAQKPPLDSLVDFGWFSFIAKPLFLAMRLVYNHVVHNWGWAIIILTVVLNVTLFPLKLKSIQSAQKMQKIAPIVKDIQEKYKQYKINDPRKQRMNEEIMKLYKEHGVNPLGGCGPMILQLPILYGFYELLVTAIELRHAPWILWVRDLSAPDKPLFHLGSFPISLLPTVMIITMFLLQKMTPMTAVDPAQARMMTLMPLMFGIWFYALPSGLVLYYLTANIVGMAQQLLINRMMPAAAQPPAPPPARGPRSPVAGRAVAVKQ